VYLVRCAFCEIKSALLRLNPFALLCWTHPVLLNSLVCAAVLYAENVETLRNIFQLLHYEFKFFCSRNNKLTNSWNGKLIICCGKCETRVFARQYPRLLLISMDLFRFALLKGVKSRTWCCWWSPCFLDSIS